MKPQNIPKGCAAFEILVARGTGEYDRNTTSANGQLGKFGIVVGDPLVDNVVKLVPNSRGYPVQYPASFTGADQGAKDTIQRLTTKDKECPDMKYAIVGYSQGAGVMHSADRSIPASIRPKILAAVMFGDPSHKSGPGYFSGIKSMNVCNAGNKNILPDPVCASSTKSFCFDAHVHYFEPQFMGPAVEFIAKAFLGKPVQNTQVTGNDPWTADASLKGADGSPSYPAKLPAKANFLGLI